jgi:hypothetical protein
MPPIDVSKPALRGLLVPDLRLGFDSIYVAGSSFEQAGPLPGVPEAQGETEMVLESSGTQSADRKLRIRASKAGQPEPDGGSFAWRDVAGPLGGAELWRGWDGPHALAYFEFYDYTTTAGKWKHPHAITLTDGTVIVVCEKSSRYVTCLSRSPVTGAWAEVTIHDNGSAFALAAHATVLALPSGRLLAFFFKEDTANSENQVRMHYSDDNGASWALANKACLSAALTSVGVNRTPHRLRVAYLNGQILLVGWVEDQSIAARADVLYQWASVDLGSSFDLVDSWDGAGDTSWAAYPSVFAANNQFVVHYLTRDLTATGVIVPYQRRIANAYQVLATATAERACQSGNPMKWGSWAAGPPLVFNAGELSSWVDEDGVFYMAGVDFDGGALRESYVQRSTDGGATWAAVGSGSSPAYGAAWWRGDDVSTRPTDLAGTAQGGRAVLVHKFNANPETHDDGSLGVSYLGGYTTLCLPQLNAFPSPAARVAWERTWLPFDLPEDTGGVWTLVVGGAPTVTMTSTGLRLQGGAGDAQSYTLTTNPTSTNTQGMIALLDVLVAGGTAFAQLRSGVAGPVAYEIRVSVTTTAITLRDMYAGADIATIATAAGVTGVQILLAVGNDSAPGNDGKGAAWYRPAGSGTDRAWVAIGASTTLTQGGGVTNEFQWGMLAAVGTDSRFRQACYTYGSYAGQQLYSGQSNPGELQGRNFSPTPLYVNDGTTIAAVDGPAFYADEWHVNTRYEYGIENVFPAVSPSPARGWRSVATTSAQRIELEYDAALNERTPALEPMIGVGLFEINFRTFYVEGYDGAAWQTLATVDTATGQSGLKFTRWADTVFPQPLPTVYAGATQWYTYHVLADSYFAMAGQENEIEWNIPKKIRTNSEGVFSNVATKTTRIELYDVQPGDPTGAIGFEEGSIWSKDVVVLINGATRYSRLRIRIPAQETAEGYFKIGTALIGSVATFARQYSRGRALGVEPNANLATSRSGTRRSRKLGKARRTVELAWTDGVDVTQATKPSPSPDYVTGWAGSAEAIGSPHDTPYLVAGVAEQLSGAVWPVVYLAGFDRPNNNGAIVVNNRNTFMLARIVSNVRLESRLGSEWGNPGELFNVATVTLEEEV